MKEKAGIGIADATVAQRNPSHSVAQLVRASVCGTECRRFESALTPHTGS